MDLEKKIAAQREKLLSLSLQNPLLSMRLSARSATLVRVIHELPDELFRRIVRGESPMRFEGLPDVEDGIPSDEKTEAFEQELARAKLTDEEYQQAVSLPAPTDENEAAEAYQRIEFALRDRVRALLEMPVINREHQETEIETALKKGLNTSYDLPRPELGEHRPEYEDNQIQTLLRQKDLERRERNLHRDVKTKEQDLGYSSLFATFGCLEWIDQGTPDRRRHAPLILAPLEMEMKSFRGARRLYVGASDREPLTINICLKERLRRDNLILPEFEMDEDEDDYVDTPETYFEKVEEWLQQNRPEWRLRRFVNISSIQFARLAMYKDLDPDLWRKRPSADGLLGQMLGGPVTPTEKAHETSEQTRALEEAFDLPLIRDADASQLAAISAALRGESFGLQGPPGAGKSQTIANLIAAAIAKGERVLFMAEKIAALNVVFDRLKDAGLGQFCLELHSNKARKTDFVAALKARLEMGNAQTPRNMDAALADLKTLRARLNDYADLIGKPFGQRQEALHDVIWNAALARRRLDETAPGEISKSGLRFEDAAKAGKSALEDCQRALSSYVAQLEAVRGAADATGVHPFFGLTIVDPSRFSQDRVFEALSPAITSLKSIVETFGQLFDLESTSIERLVALASEVRGAPKTIDPLALATLEVLRTADGARLQAFLSAVEAFQALQEPKALARDEAAFQADEKLAILATGTARAELNDSARLDELSAHLAEMRLRRGEMEDVRQAGEDLLAGFGLDAGGTFGDVAACLDALDLVDTAPPWTAQFQKSPLSEDALATLEASAERAANLQIERSRLAKIFDLDRLPPDAAERIRLAETLEGAGLFGFLSSDVRSAQRAVKEAAAGGASPKRGAAAEALRASVGLQQAADELSRNQVLISVFGDRAGVDAPFAEALPVERHKLAVAQRFAGVSRVERRLKEFLLSAPSDRASPPVFTPSQREAMREYLAASPASYQLSKLAREAETLGRKIVEADKLVEALERVGLDPEVKLADVSRLRAARAAYLVERDRLDAEPAFSEALNPFLAGAQTDVAKLRALMKEADAIDAFPISREQRSAFETVAGYAEALETLAGLDTALKALGLELSAFARAAQLDPQLFVGHTTLDGASPSSLLARLERVAASPDNFASWAQRCAARAEATSIRGLEPVVAYLDAVERIRAVDSSFAALAFDYADRIELLDAAYAAHPTLPRMRSADLGAAQTEFKSADKALRDLDRRRAIAMASGRKRNAPEGDTRGTVATLTEMRLIRYLAEQKRPRQAIRSVLQRADAAISAIMPCALMSPSSVAQFLPRTTDLFDLVIIDEASQMRPEDALGALMRSKRAVIVGDPEQMPPSNLFEPRNVAGDPVEEDEEDDFGDVESILVLANGRLPKRRELRWHYRSRHESLIAFSNAHIYDGRLEVFPSPVRDAAQLGVSYEAVESGYKSGVSTNVTEAEAVIRHAARHAAEHPEDSLGLVALNKKQSDLLFEMVEQLRSEDPTFNEFCARWEDGLEPVFIKNLENVQGDERDAIIISTVYGRNKDGRRASQFPLLNRPTGYRRLNVLITRAKKRVTVVTSLKPGEITETALKNRGVKLLADYIEYARTGELLLDAEFSGLAPESPFEAAVIAALRQRGYEVEPQVGAVGYRIDIGVRDPSNRDRFILGVECDGARYHSTPSARERDRLRQEVLESLGWRLHRIWSTSWFENEEAELKKLVATIEARAGTEGPALKFLREKR